MRSILRDRPILGDALLGAFGRSLGEQDLSPVTARGYLHNLGKFRGWLEGEAVVCPWHSWTFSTRTGVAEYPVHERVAVFPLRVEGEEVLVDIGERGIKLGTS